MSLLDEIVEIVSPLETEALAAVVKLLRQIVSHPDGAKLAATRQAEALAAEAAIRS